MEKSLFIEWVQKYFKGITVSVVKKLNDKNEETLRYRFKEMLKKEYSVDGKWESIVGEYNNVAADMVSMDSTLPLKLRDSLSKAFGDIAKLGMKLYLTEKQLQALDILLATKATDAEICAKLFEDVSRNIAGIYERIELTFLRGLGNGVTLAEDADNDGTAVRLDYKYLPSHKFGVSVKWNDPATATPLDDIDRMLEQATADGNKPAIVLAARKKLRQLGACKQMKEEYAFYKDISAATTMPNISVAKLNEYFESERGFKFDIIDRIVKVEKNGNRTNINPWNDNMLIFLSDYNVGKLVWTKCAEMNHRAKDVEYQIADDFILLSKYHKIDPLREYTSSQAFAVPVITEVNDIYQLDTDSIQA